MRHIYNDFVENCYGQKTRLFKIEESTLNRVVAHHGKEGYCIVSACRARIRLDGTAVKSDEEVPEEELMHGQQLVAENNKRTVALRKMIEADNHSYLPVFGGFKELGTDVASYEKSFVVFNFDRHGEKSEFSQAVADCLKYGKHFTQDSILVKAPNENPKYILCSDESVDMEFSGDITFNDLTKEYFTALKQFKTNKDNRTEKELSGKPQRFTFEGVYVNPKPDSIVERTRRGSHGEIMPN